MFANTVACVGMFVLVLVGWSVPVSSGFVPLSSFGPTRPGTLQIQHPYGAMDPFQVLRPAHSHLSSLSIHRQWKNT